MKPKTIQAKILTTLSAFNINIKDLLNKYTELMDYKYFTSVDDLYSNYLNLTPDEFKKYFNKFYRKAKKNYKKLEPKGDDDEGDEDDDLSDDSDSEDIKETKPVEIEEKLKKLVVEDQIYWLDKSDNVYDKHKNNIGTFKNEKIIFH